MSEMWTLQLLIRWGKNCTKERDNQFVSFLCNVGAQTSETQFFGRKTSKDQAEFRITGMTDSFAISENLCAKSLEWPISNEGFESFGPRWFQIIVWLFTFAKWLCTILHVGIVTHVSKCLVGKFASKVQSTSSNQYTLQAFYFDFGCGHAWDCSTTTMWLGC